MVRGVRGLTERFSGVPAGTVFRTREIMHAGTSTATAGWAVRDTHTVYALRAARAEVVGCTRASKA
jgi:hypothetical protein